MMEARSAPDGEPAGPVIDAHQHFWWNPSTERYPWMTAELSSIRRTFAPSDLRSALEAAGVDGTVLVQTRSSEEETAEFLALADDTDFIRGVVGWVDLTAADIGERLRALRAGRGGNYLVAIRHQVHDEPDARWLVREDVLRGLAVVDAAGLAYDLLVRTRELPAAREVAGRFPRMRFVIDHIAKPPIERGEMREWSAAMAPMSDLDNVWCKLSGMVTEASWTDWTADDLRPYVQCILAWFGEDRVIFGSDWPVCLLAASYEEVIRTYKEVLGRPNRATEGKIMGGNAINFYRLQPVGGRT